VALKGHPSSFTTSKYQDVLPLQLQHKNSDPKGNFVRGTISTRKDDRCGQPLPLLCTQMVVEAQSGVQGVLVGGEL